MDERREKRHGRETEEKDRKNKEEHDREERRRRIVRRRRYRKVISFLFIVVLLSVGVLLFIRTPLFKIEIIDIKGNSRVSTETIMKTGGLATGENIFDCNKNTVEAQLISVPYISKVSVVKKYPSKIIVTVKEEDEFAALVFDDAIISCDKNGKSIRGITAERAEELVCLKNLKRGDFSLGEYVVLDSQEQTELLKKCLSVINVYEFTDVSEIRIIDKYNVEFVLNGNLTIKLGELGSDDEIAYKISCVKEVIDDRIKGESGTVDARKPEVGIFHSPGDGKHDTIINAAEEEEDGVSSELEKTEEVEGTNEDTTEEISE